MPACLMPSCRPNRWINAVAEKSERRAQLMEILLNCLLNKISSVHFIHPRRDKIRNISFKNKKKKVVELRKHSI